MDDSEDDWVREGDLDAEFVAVSDWVMVPDLVSLSVGDEEMVFVTVYETSVAL